MKQLLAKQKIVLIVIVAIILAGISVICTTGFKLGVTYSNSKRIDVYIGKEFNISDVKKIANEIFEGKTVIQKAEKTADYASITVIDANEEQTENFKNKISEKYGVKEQLQSVKTTEIPSTDVTDTMKPYIFPVGLVSLIAVTYFIIRFRKKGAIDIGLIAIGAIIVIQALYFSIIAILRIPFNDFIMPIALFIYIITLMVCTWYFENKMEMKK